YVFRAVFVPSLAEPDIEGRAVLLQGGDPVYSKTAALAAILGAFLSSAFAPLDPDDCNLPFGRSNRQGNNRLPNAPGHDASPPWRKVARRMADDRQLEQEGASDCGTKKRPQRVAHTRQ